MPLPTTPARPPALSPDLYDRVYFLTNCGGYREYQMSRGEVVEPRIERLLDLARVQPGDRVLDLGCGRGEVAVQAARRGAQVVALDYSAAALELAQAIVDRQPVEIRGRIHLQRADAKRLPYPGQVFDRVLLSDIVEHLQPWELRLAFAELARVIAPTGRLIIHTFPNRWHYVYGYPIRRLGARLAGRQLPRDPRSEYERRLHVNEQGPWGLWQALGEFFACAVWLEPADQPRAPWRRAVSPLIPGDLLRGNDIWVIGRPLGRTRRGVWQRLADQSALTKPEPPRGPWPSALTADLAHAPYFGSGWYAVEVEPPPFRWTSACATVFLGSAPSGRLHLELAANRPPSRPVPRVTLRRGRQRYTFVAPAGWQTVTVDRPGWSGSDAPLEIRVSSTWVPATALGSSDRRRLGIAVRRVCWE